MANKTTRRVVVRLEGEELLDFNVSWRRRVGLDILFRKLITAAAEVDDDYREVLRRLQERHPELEGIEHGDTGCVLYEPHTGEFYRRSMEPSDEPQRGDDCD